ncbi:acyl-CoA thioesterase [Marinobacter halodurans]|uniref:Acyl-CoA thioesterase n=1 Tax=Marinobacter halodurans TaxID=2528979 RepID=A0ABY1ZIZ2_9GAMM|nr:thioesterase family protein [Marinobacter halodurans]TBW54719.1 acyl-CoA thioesterase [Marinobacter halodurans]
MSEFGRLVHSLDIPMRWGDMDAYGHANNTVYFRFFEEARITWLDSENLRNLPDGTGPVIIKTSATFLKELNYPSTVTIRTYVGKAGNSSLETFYELHDSETGDKYADGYARIVWFDHQTRKSTRLPDRLRALAAE